MIQPDCKGTTGGGDGLHFDLPMMLFHDLAGNGQAQSQAAEEVAADLILVVKAVKYFWQRFG
jgi:hypothetical protein